jgi:hypothetical protein
VLGYVYEPRDHAILLSSTSLRAVLVSVGTPPLEYYLDLARIDEILTRNKLVLNFGRDSQ